LIRAAQVNKLWYKHTQTEKLWQELWERKCNDMEQCKNVCFFNFLSDYQASKQQNENEFYRIKKYNDAVEKHFRSTNPEGWFGQIPCNTRTALQNTNDMKEETTSIYKDMMLIPHFFGRRSMKQAQQLKKYAVEKKDLKLWLPPKTFPPAAAAFMIVGDGAVGKTSLVMSIVTGSFPEDYVPTVFDLYNLPVVWNGIPFSIELRDTGGQDDWSYRLRSQYYVGTTFIALAFSVTYCPSFTNIEKRWNSDVNHNCPGVAKILVGTKIDIRDDPQTAEGVKKTFDPTKLVSTEEGEAMAKRIGAIAYVETSALKGINLFRVVEEGINYSFGSRQSSGNKCCVM